MSPHPTDFTSLFTHFIDAADASGHPEFDVINDAFCDRGITTGYCGGSKTGPLPEDTEALSTSAEEPTLSNYPNPFNPETVVHFSLAAPQKVRLSVYDVLGRRVAVLLDARREAGTHTVRFDAETLPSGPYLLQLETASHLVEKTMILQR